MSRGKVSPSDREYMNKRGLVPATELALRMEVDVTTIRRWLDEGEVDGEDVKGRRCAVLRSVILAGKISPDHAVFKKLITEAQATKLKKEMDQS